MQKESRTGRRLETQVETKRKAQIPTERLKYWKQLTAIELTCTDFTVAQVLC